MNHRFPEAVYKCKETELVAVNQMRRQLGMREIVHTIKKCLTCGNPFMSDGPSNRQCLTHRKVGSIMFPGGSSSRSGRVGYQGTGTEA